MTNKRHATRRVSRGAAIAAFTAAVTIGTFGVSVPAADAHIPDCLPSATDVGTYLACLVTREEHCVLVHLTVC
jgi:hypothetical protein